MQGVGWENRMEGHARKNQKVKNCPKILSILYDGFYKLLMCVCVYSYNIFEKKGVLSENSEYCL